MKDKALIFLILALVTGLIGFSGLEFYGVIGIRVLFLIFADLLVISLLSNVFFPNDKKLRPVRVKK